MKIEVHKEEYNKKINFSIDTGSTCEPIEKEVIESCLDRLNLDSSWNQKFMLKNVAKEIKTLIQVKK
jgi:hypothetical protein